MADEKKKPQDKVADVVAAFNSSWNYTSSSYHKTWQDMDDLYNSRRVNVGYNGISDTFVPMSFSTVETIVSATAGEKPQVEYIATKPEQNTNVEVLNGLFSYYWDLDQWTNKKTMSIRQMFKLGTTVEYYFWDIDHPAMRLIALRDFFIDPTATLLNYQNAAYMGYRFLANKETLKQEQIIDIDEESKTYGELIPKYKNLDKLDTNYEVGDQTDKQEKDTHMGSTLDKTAQEGQIEVLCYWTKDEVIYVGNRSEIIYQSPNYFKERQQFLGWENPEGMYPFVIDANLPDESLLYGTSVLASIAKPQELLNDLTNQNIDAVTWSLDPVMELDPMYSSYIDKIRNVPGAVYPFKPNSYQAVNKPQIPANAFNERVNIKNEIRETTAVDEILKGIGAQSRTTAAEIKAQVASAGRRFDLVVSGLENSGYYVMAKLIFQMVQMYVTQPTMYRVIGEKGVNWELFDPEQFKGDYEPRVKLKIKLDEEKNRTMRNLKEMYTALLGSPYIDQEQMTRLVVQRGFELSREDTDGLIKSQDQLAQESAGGPPPKDDGPSPEEIALAAVGKAYGKGATPDIEAQLEAMAGLEPSVVHEGGMESLATKQMSEQVMNSMTAMPMPNSPPGVIPTSPQPMGSPPAPRENIGV